MRAGPDPEPLPIAPVAEVVQRAFPRARPVRDLVVAVAGHAKVTFSLAIHPRDDALIGLSVQSVAPPALENAPSPARPVGVRFLRIEPQLEGVAGRVIRREREGRTKVLPPVVLFLAGPTEDEVEVDVKTCVARGRDRRRAVFRLMGAPERPEAMRAEALHAERQTRDANIPPGG